MKKSITLGDRSVELNSSIGWLYVYRETFGRDILPDIMPALQAVLTLGVEIMKEAADGKININDVLGHLDDDTLDTLSVTLSGLEFTSVLNIVWAMAKNADSSIPAPREFFNEFDCAELDKVLPEVLQMVIKSSVTSKNAIRLLQRGATQ